MEVQKTSSKSMLSACHSVPASSQHSCFPPFDQESRCHALQRIRRCLSPLLLSISSRPGSGYGWAMGSSGYVTVNAGASARQRKSSQFACPSEQLAVHSRKSRRRNVEQLRHPPLPPGDTTARSLSRLLPLFLLCLSLIDFDSILIWYCFVLKVPFLDASRISQYLDDPAGQHFLGHHLRMLHAGYALGSDVYSSQGRQTAIGQPGEGPRSACRTS